MTARALLLSVLLAAPQLLAGTGSVMVNFDATSNKAGIDSMSRSLGTTPARSPDKKAFLSMVQQSDVVYVNTHVCTPRDRPDLNGNLLLGPAWKSDGKDTVSTADVLSAVSGKGQPRLVVLAGCDAAHHGWNEAFGGATVVTFTKSIRGVAADIYFRYVLERWTGSDVTLDEALRYADGAWKNDPDVKMLARDLYGLGELRSVMKITGSRSIRWKSLGGTSPVNGTWKFVDSPGAKPYVIEVQGSDGDLVGVILESPETVGYKQGTNMFVKGRLSQGVYQIEWLQYPDDSQRYKLSPTTTPAKLTLRPDGQSFVVTGRNRLYGYQYQGPKDRPTATRKEGWLNEFGKKEFRYSFIRIQR